MPSMRIEPKENFSKCMCHLRGYYTRGRSRHYDCGGGELRAERTRKEIQLALQRIAVTVSYLSRIGGDSIERCLQPPRQSLELLSAVGLDPPPIRMLLAALQGKLPAKVRV